MSADELLPPSGEVVDDPHGLIVTKTLYGRLAVCRCYEWDGWWNGPTSERFVREEHARHVEVARRAAGEV